MGLTNASTGRGLISLRQKTAGDGSPCRVIALAGNPNVGKSTVFNALTGLRQHTGNWPGKTVTSARGICEWEGERFCLADLPGCYSLLPHSPEEEAARDFLCSGEADAAVVVCDATCLERNLTLALQTIALFPRTIVCVNLCDEARRKGIVIDLAALSRLLGVRVIGTEARAGRGLDSLMRAVSAVCRETPGAKSCPEILSQALTEEAWAEETVHRAESIARECVSTGAQGYSPTDRRLDRLFTHRITGFPLMLLLLAGILWLTLEGSNYPSSWLGSLLLGQEEPLYQLLLSWGAPESLCGLLAHGVYRVLSWVVSVMLPPMAIFFPLFTLLEDAGYLPRVAFNLDRCFQRCRACGKQALTTW